LNSSQMPRYKLVIADDKSAIRDGLCEFVEQECHEFLITGVYEDGEQIISHLARNHTDVVITDISMPKKTGIDAAEYARDASPDTIMILITGYREFEYAKSAIDLGVTHFISKPINFDELYNALSSAARSIEQKTRGALDQSRELLMQNDSRRLFIRLIMSGILQANVLHEYGGLLQIPAENCRCAVVDFTCPKEPDCEKFNLSEHFWQDLCENCTDSYDAYCLRETADTASFFLFCRKPDAESAAETAENFARLSASLMCGAYQTEPVFDVHVYDNISAAGRNTHNEAEKMYSDYMFNGETEVAEKVVRIAAQSFTPDMRVRFLKDVCDKLREDRDMESLSLISPEQARDPHEFLEIMGRINNLISNLLQEKRSIISEIKRYIDDHCDISLSRDNVAEAFSVHPNYLSGLFKKETGESFAYYAGRARIKKAKELLKSGEYDVSQAAVAVGYSSEKHFERIFKSHTGMSPKKYMTVGHMNEED